MVQIPPEPPVTEATLAEWFLKKAALAKAQAEEMLLRKRIAAAMFPTPKEGSNTHTLSDGHRLVMTHTVSRKLDEPMLQTLWEDLAARGINLNEVVRRKPELAIGKYKELTEEQRLHFDQCLTISDGAPAFKIEPPAKPRGSK